MNNDSGLKNEIVFAIKYVLRNYPVKKAYLFGSRARGDHNRTSDIDIAIEGDSLNSTVVNYIINDMELLDTPLSFDIVNLNEINKKELRNNIKKEGVIIYDNPE